MTQAKPKPKLAFEEFLEYDDGTDTRYELVDGVPVEVAPESRLNDRLAMRLMGFLLPFVGSMERFSKGVQIEVTPLPGMKNQTRVFDLAVIPSELEAILGDGQIITRKMPNPLLVVEFVSSYSSTGAKNYQRDYIEKRKQYEQRQIPEYWIIDATAQKITVLTLKDKSYAEKAFAGPDQIISTAFPALDLTSEKIFARYSGETQS